MPPRNSRWKLVTEYGVESYSCGLRAGDVVELTRPLAVRDHSDVPTGKVYPAGERWTVLSGSRYDPGVVWFLQANGDRCTWDDDAAQINEWFRRVEPAA
jgi:hypothetical protein